MNLQHGDFEPRPLVTKSPDMEEFQDRREHYPKTQKQPKEPSPKYARDFHN